VLRFDHATGLFAKALQVETLRDSEGRIGDEGDVLTVVDGKIKWVPLSRLRG
jgi:protein involved in temperature-dependent protein secretion